MTLYSKLYIPKHYDIREFVDRATYERLKHNPKLLWQQFNPMLMLFQDWLRERYGKPVTVNNWCFNGTREHSGLRSPSSPFWSDTSQHSRGNATDSLVADFTAEEIRVDLKKLFDNGSPIDYVPYITLEAGVSWLHADFRPQNKPFNLFHV